MNTKIVPTDLTQRPPRSFHVRLGALVILPRMLDKGRATLAKKMASTTTIPVQTSTSLSFSVSIPKLF